MGELRATCGSNTFAISIGEVDNISETMDL